MKITYDSAKNALNIQQRGLSFDRVAEFSFETALITIDTRRDYRWHSCHQLPQSQQARGAVV